MGDRCNGHCCEGFVLPYYEELPMLVQAGRADAKETAQILGMVVLRRIVKPGERLNDGREAIEPTPVFGCKNYDAETHNCGIYETRPSMCRDYPYGKPCEFQTCEWDKGRAGAHPPEPELIDIRRKHSAKLPLTGERVVRPKPMPKLVADEAARPPLLVKPPTTLSQMKDELGAGVNIRLWDEATRAKVKKKR